LQVFSIKPEHSWYSNAADALRTFAVGYQEDVDGHYEPPKSEWYFNVLPYGKR
jgi:hypothetical protein